MLTVPFIKYAGCGNDFIFVDNRIGFFPCKEALIEQLCHRRHGIGADGLILIGESIHADFTMRIFNADGREAEMCGNGVRCCVRFLQELGIRQERYRLQTMHRTIEAWADGDDVTVDMGQMKEISWNIPITVDEVPYLVHHLDTGVPHIVLFKADVEDFQLEHWGPRFRHHPHFAPRGANFNVAAIINEGALKGQIHNRTFERGVEGETLSCGTGCTAVALAAAFLQGLPSPITVHSQAGALNIGFEIQNGLPTNVTMSGPATKIFSGSVIF